MQESDDDKMCCKIYHGVASDSCKTLTMKRGKSYKNIVGDNTAANGEKYCWYIGGKRIHAEFADNILFYKSINEKQNKKGSSTIENGFVILPIS